jgi:hypothetical protein
VGRWWRAQPAVLALVNDVRAAAGDPASLGAWKPSDGTAVLAPALVQALVRFAAHAARLPAGYRFSDATVRQLDVLGLGVPRTRVRTMPVHGR